MSDFRRYCCHVYVLNYAVMFPFKCRARLLNPGRHPKSCMDCLVPQLHIYSPDPDFPTLVPQNPGIFTPSHEQSITHLNPHNGAKDQKRKYTITFSVPCYVFLHTHNHFKPLLLPTNLTYLTHRYFDSAVQTNPSMSIRNNLS